MRRLVIFTVLLALALPAWAIDEAVQVNFLKQLLHHPQNEWLAVMAQDENRRVLDDSFLDRCDKRIRWDIDANQFEDAFRFALIADYVCKTNGKHGTYRLKLAEMFGQHDFTDMMVDILKNILLEDPNDGDAKFDMALYFRTSKMDLVQGWTLFDELQQANYRKAECLYQMAEIDLITEQEERANKELQQALLADPNHKLAKEEFERINKTTLMPDGQNKVEPGNRERAGIMFNEAESRMAAGRLEEAEGFYIKAIEADPSNVKAYVYLGALYYRLGTVDRAVTYLQQAVKLDDKDFEGWRYLGNSLERRFDTKGNKADLDEAVAAYQKGISISPQDRVIQGELERAVDKKGPSASR